MTIRAHQIGATVGVLLILVSGWLLERARVGVDIHRMQVGQTPVITYETAGSAGSTIVIANGFAGSSQMMQGYPIRCLSR